MATPPAVAAICPKRPGPCEGAGAGGAAWTGAGAGAVLAGRVVLLQKYSYTHTSSPITTGEYGLTIQNYN